MPYRVELLPAARRDLKRLPRPMQRRIVLAMQELADDPRPPGVVKLHGEENAWRIRVSDYRIVYEIYDDRLLVLVVRIRHRKDVYRKGK